MERLLSVHLDCRLPRLTYLTVPPTLLARTDEVIE
jgi:hypothetical protein